MKRNKQIRDEDHRRTFESVSLRLLSAEDRTVEVSMSSETPVPRWFGDEILVHDADAVDMSRASNGLPLLWNHNQDILIGRVEGIRLDPDRKLRGVARFARFWIAAWVLSAA